MKKRFTAIRHGDIETVKTLIENKPELVNCTAKQPPKKDDGQSPLQVAIKTNNFEIANYLLDNGADVNFIESDDSYDDWRMPVLNHAVLTAVMNCRHNVKSDLGDTVIFEEFSSKEKADEAFNILKRVLEMGADVNICESFGTSCARRLCRTAEELLPSYSWGEDKVSDTAVITPELTNDLSRIFLLLQQYNVNFNEEDINRYLEEDEHPLSAFIRLVI